MKLREPYRDLKACPRCGAPCEELGKFTFYPDGTHTYEPTPIEVRCKPNHPHGQRREVEGKVTLDKAGRETQGKRSVYYVIPYTHLCTRPAAYVGLDEHGNCGKPRPECGAIPAHLLQAYSGDVPASFYYTDGEHDVRDDVEAMRKRVAS